MELGFGAWAFIFFAIGLFFFVIYLTATNQLEDFVKLVGVGFLAIFGSLFGAIAILAAVVFRLALPAIPFLILFAGCCLLVKCIF